MAIDEPPPPSPTCPNCGEPETGAYCPRCGQSQRSPRRSPLRWARDVLAEELVLGARTPRTLRTLVADPGRLTLDWIEGRRVRYIRPLRLYIAAVAVFFGVTFFLGWPVGAELSLDRLLGGPPVPLGDDVGEIARTAMAGRMQAVLTASAFLLVPVFAAWLRVVSHRADRVFADHLVFSLHQHALLLGLATLAWPLFFLGTVGVIVGGLLLAGAGIHTFLAYRRVYPDGRPWLRFVPVGLGWSAAFAGALAFGVAELRSMLDADTEPALRYHAARLWTRSHELAGAGDTAAARAVRQLSLRTFEEVDTLYLLEWDPFRIADLQVELGQPEAALGRIETIREDHPGESQVLGLASLAAARAGDTVRARRWARDFLERAEEDSVAADAAFRHRFREYEARARELLGQEADSAAGPPG